MTDLTSASGEIAPASTGSVESPATPTPESGSAAPALATQGQPDPGSSLTTDATPNAQPGPIPYERFEQVNRRMKEAEERWSKTEQAYGDVLGLDPQQVRGMLQWYRQAGADPVAFTTQLLNDLVTNEQYRPMVASQAAKILGSLRQVKAQEEPEPQPDLVAENGAPVYSAQQLRAWRDWDSRRQSQALDARLNEALRPVKQWEEQQRVQRINQQVSEVSRQQYQQAQSWHGFKDHEAEIAKAFDANPNWDLKDAYLHVLHNSILPKLPAQAKAQVVADLQSKAAAQSLNPAGTSKPATPDFKGDFKAALEWHAGKR